MQPTGFLSVLSLPFPPAPPSLSLSVVILVGIHNNACIVYLTVILHLSIKFQQLIIIIKNVKLLLYHCSLNQLLSGDICGTQSKLEGSNNYLKYA